MALERLHAKKLLAYPLFLFLLLIAFSCGDFIEEPEEALRQVQKPLGDFCSASVEGHGILDVENDYLPKVVACENAGAPMEALKAQAIVARTYAMHITQIKDRPRALIPNTRDQQYLCDRPVLEQHREAVRATQGQVLSHNGYVFMSHYVAGARVQESNGCEPVSGDPDVFDTEKWVTYNQGRLGATVEMSGLSNNNRGAMSQEGSNCLANLGWDHQRILRFYYGDDARLIQLHGACYDLDEPAPGVLPPQDSSPLHCPDASQPPEIVERFEWGAKEPSLGMTRHSPNRITIHHTAGPSGDGSLARSIEIVQGIQTDHRDKKNPSWGDVGYHFLIDPAGRIFRGRFEDRRGAHVGPRMPDGSWCPTPTPAECICHNCDNLGIAFLGGLHIDHPPRAQLEAAARLIGYLAEKYDIELVSGETLRGHQHHIGHNTECPGEHLVPYLGIANRSGLVADTTLIDMAHSDASCEEPPAERPLKGPEIELEESSESYRYVRIRGLHHFPHGLNDHVVPGFELDAVRISPADGAPDIFAGSVVSAQNVHGATRALGAPNNTTCDNRPSTVAGVGVGAELVLRMDESFGPGAILHVIQHSYLPADADCSPSGTAEVAVSADGQSWDVLSDDVVGNWHQTLRGPRLRLIEPRRNGRSSPTVRLRAQADGPISRVEYYAEHFKLGESTSRQDSFFVERPFTVFGERLITAVGYDGEDRPVAMDSLLVRVVAEFAFLTPAPGSISRPAVELRVASPDEAVTRVTYEADGFFMGESLNRGNDFLVAYEFNHFGRRNLIARGFDAQGREIALASMELEIHPDALDLEFASPRPRGWYSPTVDFEVELAAGMDNVARVEYFANRWPIGESRDREEGFPVQYRFDNYGEREVEAVAYDANGQEVARRTIQIFVTNEEGRLPQGSLGRDLELKNPVDAAAAERLVTEAQHCSDRVQNPTASARCNASDDGWASGQDWDFVQAALLRAGIADQAGLDQLAHAGPCSVSTFYTGGSGFHCNAAGQPSVLLLALGMERVSSTPTEAPRGAVIAWDKGCLGHSPSRGHIEVSLGDGRACSDFCGPIAGDASCAAVFVPVH